MSRRTFRCSFPHNSAISRLDIVSWSFPNRIRSRSEAIRRLCQFGLVSEPSAIHFVDIANHLNVHIDNLNNELEDCIKKDYEFDSLVKYYEELRLIAFNLISLIAPIVAISVSSKETEDTKKLIDDIPNIIEKIDMATRKIAPPPSKSRPTNK